MNARKDRRAFASFRDSAPSIIAAKLWRRGPGRGLRLLRTLGPARLPLLPLAPAVVVVSCLLVAFIIALLGLADLRRAADRAALDRGSLLAEALALRVRELPSESRDAFLGQAASRAGVDVMLVSQSGDPLFESWWAPGVEGRDAPAVGVAPPPPAAPSVGSSGLPRAPPSETSSIPPSVAPRARSSSVAAPASAWQAPGPSSASSGRPPSDASPPTGSGAPVASIAAGGVPISSAAPTRAAAAHAPAPAAAGSGAGAEIPAPSASVALAIGPSGVSATRRRAPVAGNDLGPAALASLLGAETGFLRRDRRRYAFAGRQLAAPYAHLAVLVFVDAPLPPPGARALIASIASLALVLLVMAALVSYTFSKTADDDLRFVRDRIGEMAEDSATRVTELVPIRTFDQVGVLTAAFNTLVERFAAAERAYEQDLAESDALDRSRAQFLAALSHELRTPLNAILGFADLMLAEVEGPLTPSAREDIEIIRNSGGHLRSLIDDVLDLSAMETGKLRLDRTRVDLSDLAEQVVREAAMLVVGKPVVLRVEAEPGVVAMVDRRRVRQVMANLVSNAAKFTQEGSVTVRIRQAGEEAVIEVADTGPGVPAVAQGSIFEEYAQAGDVASRRKGTGLGLAISRRLTEMHAGRLTLVSAVGQGSTFVVELPLRADAPDSTRPPPSSRRGVSTGAA